MDKKLPGIPLPKDRDILWRYLSFEKFVSLLSTKSLYFATANQFEDPFEGHVPLLIDKLYKQHTAFGRGRKSDCNKIMGRIA